MFRPLQGVDSSISIGRIKRIYESLKTYDTNILYIWQNLIASNRILIGTISRLSCPFVGVKLVIHDVMCGFWLVRFTAQNLISRGLPSFGSFCKPLRYVVTETFAEPSANWEVSSNRILTGRPSDSFINVKLVIHYLMYGFRPFSLPVDMWSHKSS